MLLKCGLVHTSEKLRHPAGRFFSYADDPFQRACLYAAHIRKTNRRDDLPDRRAEMLTHRTMRAAIPFGPEVMPGEPGQHAAGMPQQFVVLTAAAYFFVPPVTALRTVLT
jgi:deferrochelatase/peroxidase EfeB